MAKRLMNTSNWSVLKRKGDTQDRGKYRGLYLLSHMMTLPQITLDKRLCETDGNELGDEPKGLKKTKHH